MMRWVRPQETAAVDSSQSGCQVLCVDQPPSTQQYANPGKSLQALTVGSAGLRIVRRRCVKGGERVSVSFMAVSLRGLSARGDKGRVEEPGGYR